MNAAVFMLTSAFGAVDAPAPAPMPAPAMAAPAPAPVVSTGSACGGSCGTPACAPACDPCGKPKLFDKLKAKMGSISWPSFGGCKGDCICGPGPLVCDKPAPVVYVKPQAIVNGPACNPCDSCGGPKFGFFDKIKSRIGCHKAEPACETCGTPASPCAGATTTVPPSVTPIPAPAPAPIPTSPVPPKEMPKTAPAPAPIKVGAFPIDNSGVTPVVGIKAVSPF